MDEHTRRQSGPTVGQRGLLLSGLTPRHVARTIHGLQSRLVSLVYAYDAGQPVLVYTCEVCGKVEAFRTVVDPNVLESISDLYPEAAALERALGRIGLVFDLPQSD
jgi:hypothetical protein